jgi:hypothetical protein
MIEDNIRPHFSAGRKTTMKISLAITGLLICGASFDAPAQAGGVPYVDTITAANTEEVSLFILPDAAGSPLVYAQAYGGAATDARLTVRVVGADGAPIPYFPLGDLWLDSDATTQHPCVPWGFVGDDNSNSNGEVTFANPLAGGGWSEGPVWLYIYGVKAFDLQSVEVPPVAIRFNSADINADGIVGLTDVPLFASDFYGLYAYRSDFHWDGALNLSDLTRLATSLGSSCP